MITAEQYRIIDRWISAVETGNPDGDYGKVTVLNDGPGGVRQITFGKHQTTEAGGNLIALILLMRASSSFGYLNRDQIKVLSEFVNSDSYCWASLAHPDEIDCLASALTTLGLKTPEIQDEFFQKKYWFPACRWAEKNGFKSPLAHLVIYDSFIQSGGILMLLRKRFPEPVPVNGGHEYRWLDQYVTTRHQWLKHWGNGRDPKSVTLRKTVYRTAGLISLLHPIDPWLTSRPIRVNGIRVD
jgi:chitosanase